MSTAIVPISHMTTLVAESIEHKEKLALRDPAKVSTARNRLQFVNAALGMMNGLAIVALAIIFDRVSQSYGERLQRHRHGEKHD